MTPSENAWFRLRAALKHYVLILVTVTVVVAVVALLTTPGVVRDERPRYEASALVVASELTMRPEGLPRFATAVFEGGSVSQAAAAAGNLPYEPRDLVPDHAQLRPYANTVVMKVTGTDGDPALAASIANSFASAFVDELNRAGPGVGVFAVQDTARVPLSPIPEPGPVVPLAIGLSSGVVLALGIIGLLLLTRRPLLTPLDAGAAAGAPVLGSFRISRNGLPTTLPAGSAALGRRLFERDVAACGLLSSRTAASARMQIAAAIARAQAQRSTVYLVSEANDTTWDELRDDGIKVVPNLPARLLDDDHVIVVDDPSEAELLALVPPVARLILVVESGERTAIVEQASTRVLAGELTGVVYVDRPRQRWATVRSIATDAMGKIHSPQSRKPGASVSRRPTAP